MWGLTGHGHDHGHSHAHEHEATPAPQQTLARRLTAVAVPFGVAASPDLTILPVALAASAVGRGAVVGVIVVFAVVTMATFIGLTVLATLVGYQIKGEWLERHAATITAVGIVAYIGF